MQTSSIRFLNQLNQKFYETVADSFDDSRSYSWTGWEVLKPFILKLIEGKKEKSGDAPGEPLRVLDIGCGNGRFAQWLSEVINLAETTTKIEYTGIDFNEFLLQKARERTQNLPKVTTDFKQIDIVESLLQKTPLSTQKYDLIVCFGVMHHIPGQEMRQKLVEQISKLMVESEKSNSIACIATWQFDSLPNLFSRSEQLQDSGLIPDPEAGDYLLNWERKSAGETLKTNENKNQTPTPRFCHLISDEESEEWWQTTKLSLIQKYLADGPKNQSNAYWIVTNNVVK